MSLGACVPKPVIEVLHGEAISDPYRWLEDRSLSETELWIREQQRHYDEYFSIGASLEPIRDRVRSFLDVESIDQPARVAGRYFYRRRNRDQEQAGIYVRDIASDVERLLVDPSNQGPFTSVSIHRISPSGSLVAYELKQGGEDKHAIFIVDVDSGHTMPDRLDVGYARGFTFTSNDDGFYFCRDTADCTEDHTIRLHLFREADAGSVVFRVPHTVESRLILTADNVHLGAIWLHQKNSEQMADFFIASRGSESKWTNVFSNKTSYHHPFLHQGRILVLKSTEGGRLSMIELASDGQEMRAIIPARETAISQIAMVKDMIYASYLDQGIPCIDIWTLDGQPSGQIDVPTDGSIHLLPSHSQNESSLFYGYESFDQPLTIFEYSSKAQRSHVWHRYPLTDGLIRSRIRRVSFQSNDGTAVPLTLVTLGDMSPDRPSPVILTAYGGFGTVMTPQFSVLATIMKEVGAVFAIAHVRGGGEFGKAWHDAGRQRNRQNAFNDFIAAGEWLCMQGITTPDKLGIFGASNAGLLVAAVMTQRPEMFGAVLCIAPLLDMVRYQHFDQADKWREEYGTIADAEDFSSLYAYSPYHHVESDVDYPPVMFVTGDRDDRCNPAHVRKMAARLQCRIAQRSPVIVDYSEERGHSPVLPLSTRVEALARRISFLCNELKVLQPAGGGHEAICH